MSELLDGSTGKGYLSMEVVSGDRRLLFEEAAPGGSNDAKENVEEEASTGPSSAAAAASNARSRPSVGPRSRRGRPRAATSQPASTTPGPVLDAHGPTELFPTAPDHPTEGASQPTGLPPSPRHSDQPQVEQGIFAPRVRHQTQSGSDGQLAVSSPALQNQPSLRDRQQTQPGPGGVLTTSPPAAERQPSPQGAPHAGQSGPRTPRPSPARDITIAAANLLQIPRKQIYLHAGLHTELQAIKDTPEVLPWVLLGVLGGELGLHPQQARMVLLRQPRILRVPPLALAERGLALAAALGLPLLPPRPLASDAASGADGGGEAGAGEGAGALAAVVVAAPDVLLRPGGFGEARDELATALGLPPPTVLALLRQQPHLLRHPAGYFRRLVSELQRQLGLAPAKAAALAAAEPVLLSVSPGVLRANGEMLKKELTLTPAQLAGVVSQVPELLVRSPGNLRAVATRLVTELRRSTEWREQLPRLLGSARNLAVALSFSSDRYERLEYLRTTRRDGIMGFKDALSMEAEEFQEVFPEYLEWRREQLR